MKHIIVQTYYRLLNAVSTEKYRYLFSSVDMSHRLIGIVGARGTGKTTILLQYIKERIDDHDKALYFSADHIYFVENSLFEFVQEQYELEGRIYFCIDEIHKYPNWNQELKNIYDSFPSIHVAFSGSSSIDLIKGSYDLSRRGLLYRLKGLSFREYLNFEYDMELTTYSFETIIAEHQKISRELSEIPQIMGHFRNYLQNGFYPFFFEDRDNFSERLLSIIEKTVYEDIASFYNLKTGNIPILKKILAYFATIQPGEISFNTIAKSLRIDNKTLMHYIEILTATGLLLRIGVDKEGAAMIRKPEKVFLNNPNMYHTLLTELGHSGRIGTVRENFFISMLKGADEKVFYCTTGDYTCRNTIFEIGGKNKDLKQLKNIEKSYLVKDDTLVSGSKREIPLYLWGFLY